MIGALTKFVAGAFKLLLALAVVALGLAFYAGMRFAEKDSAGAPEAAPEPVPVAAAPESVPAVAPAPANAVPAAPAAPAAKLPPSERAKNVIFELSLRKKTAQRHVQETEKRIAELRAQNADEGLISELRERAESLRREIANCDAALEQAKRALENARRAEARERENAPHKLLENL
ncbi:MAG: hypothetical protein ACI4QA_01055 [Candidatus Spyradosoma sp.]